MIKLLAIKIVANKHLGVLNKFEATSAALSLLSFNSILSVGLKEKNATSEPDINAEDINKNISTNKDIQISISRKIEFDVLSKKQLNGSSIEYTIC